MRYFLDNLWLWKCGLPETQQNKIPDLDVLKATEWSCEFEQYMRNRLVMGAIRYGRINEQNKSQYNRVESMLKRLHKYNESGNKEVLIDVANLCLLEFVECHHPLQHFHAVDEQEHVSIKF